MSRRRARFLSSMLLCVAVAGGATSCARSTPRTPPRTAPLEGTRWILAEVGGRQAPHGMETQPVMLQLDRALVRATGYAGVNRFSGNYELQGASLQFGLLATTRRAGPPEAESLEASVLTALAATAGWKITGGSLELVDANGARLMRFDAGTEPR